MQSLLSYSMSKMACGFGTLLYFEKKFWKIFPGNIGSYMSLNNPFTAKVVDVDAGFPWAFPEQFHWYPRNKRMTCDFAELAGISGSTSKWKFNFKFVLAWEWIFCTGIYSAFGAEHILSHDFAMNLCSIQWKFCKFLLIFHRAFTRFLFILFAPNHCFKLFFKPFWIAEEKDWETILLLFDQSESARHRTLLVTSF